MQPYTLKRVLAEHGGQLAKVLLSILRAGCGNPSSPSSQTAG